MNVAQGTLKSRMVWGEGATIMGCICWFLRETGLKQIKSGKVPI